MSMDQQEPTPICTVDPDQYLQIKRNQDGTITRLMEFPSIPATPDPTTSPSSVLSKDFPLNPTNNTFLRVFLPQLVFSGPDSISSNDKLPVIVYFHGGGFVILHADSAMFHVFCSDLAVHATAIVVSVEYRLAPEHRLPAAYEDAVDALHWISASARSAKDDQDDNWFSRYADFSNCFLMGTSAGGNIAYHAALQASKIMDDLQPLRLKGLILHHAFFGGSSRTGSELRLINNQQLPLSGSDLFWDLALPIGSSRDHEYCNPTSSFESGLLERIKEMDCRVLVTGCSGDPLVDRLVEFVKVLEGKGVRVNAHFTEGDYHGVEIMDPSKSEPLFVVVKSFINCC